MYKKDGKYGLIDMNGKKITKAIYDSIENLRPTEGKFIVSKDGKYGCIDVKGNKLVDVKYDKIDSDKYYTKEDTYKKSGFIVAEKQENGYKYGYINYKGKKILDLKYNEITRIILDDKDVYTIVSENDKYGLCKDDKIIMPIDYQNISYNEKLKLLIIEKNKKYGVADLNGKIILDFKYEKIENKGIYMYAKTGETTEVYDANGNKIEIEPNRSIYETENENYKITTISNNNITYYGIVDKNQNKLVDEKYRFIEYAFENYFIATNENGDLGVIDNKGNTILEMKYKSLQKIKEKNIIQGVNKETNKTEFYQTKMQKVLEIDSPSVQAQDEFIVISTAQERIYLDKNGNKIEDKSKIQQENLPEKIGEYTKKQVTIDSIYYSK